MEPSSFGGVRVVIILQDLLGRQTFSDSASPVDVSRLSSDGVSRPRSEPGNMIHWRRLLTEQNLSRVADVKATDLMRFNSGGDVIDCRVSKFQHEPVLEKDLPPGPEEGPFNAAGVQREEVLSCNRVELPSGVSSC